jgi:hypothetical protein
MIYLIKLLTLGSDLIKSHILRIPGTFFSLFLIFNFIIIFVNENRENTS